MKNKPEKDDPDQSKRFVETAKKLEADKSDKEFEKVMEILSPVPKTDKKTEASGKR
jgi:hypothetical protein